MNVKAVERVIKAANLWDKFEEQLLIVSGEMLENKVVSLASQRKTNTKTVTTVSNQNVSLIENGIDTLMEIEYLAVELRANYHFLMDARVKLIDAADDSIIFKQKS